MSVSANDMKDILRFWASGVTVVTTATDQARSGTTASSFTSVSLEPPLVLICLYHEVATVKQIEQNGHFAISILAEGQQDVSGQMAGYIQPPEGKDRFEGLAWQTAQTGSLIYADALAWLDCKLHAIHDGGTHKIIVGEVVSAGKRTEEAPPLMYFNRAYRQLT